ncbi:MAG TPA: MBL fold metallo-hydrolase [Herpetosiphon sp.]|uniref:Beta-lactamase domain protein n=1 Tax=Herpetosiphon aurantiacus (strain ATCC 23779 / DSM 785 / 114-95) TaxID=316274 RepID=A9AUA7_HERA2|nr:MBL fold metallo-hydrolase [Herpetosiphon sp.]ABX03026.1 beta-lactamase domain protein [Herpetosiphon aurantiacus DSM 785]HBW50871.1 MBL fold metallo-hydrolase [Herpetosiphon sp.]
MQVRLLDTGICRVPEFHVLRDGSRRMLDCHALVALIEHPKHGWGLFDVGYSQAMISATQQLPWSLYRQATPLQLSPELEVVNQLPQYGLSAADIGWIVLSHAHADHVAALADFPQAQIYMSATAFELVSQVQGINALRRGIIPHLFPQGWHQRLHLIHEFRDQPLFALGNTHDLFGDGLLRLVELPGHARGQIGMYIANSRPILLAADGAWHSRAIRGQVLPHPIIYFMIDDAKAMATTLARLSAFAQAYPEVLIVPCHCPEIYANEVATA